jgi:SPX domain protein involved in polyphosphate accumulation
MLLQELKSFLKETANWDLNDWEYEFVSSLEGMLDEEYPPITEKQEAVMERMREKYE